MVAGSLDKTISLTDAGKSTLAPQHAQISRHASHAQASPPARLLRPCCASPRVRAWRAFVRCVAAADDRVGVKVLQGHLKGVSCVDWSPMYKFIVSGSQDRRVMLWNPFSLKPLATLMVRVHTLRGAPMPAPASAGRVTNAMCA